MLCRRRDAYENYERNGGEVEMIHIVKDMKMPEECHECPFQIKFKNGVADDWHMRRCVIEDRIIEYPRPKWCPIKPVKEEASGG